MKIKVEAYAKLNLSLDVVGKLENGYHSMRMVMESASLCDDVYMEAVKGGETAASTNLPYLPTGGKNIAVKAADLFMEEAGINGYGINIKINKRIPVCAGLGGGSSDGAAVLRGMNKLFNAGFSRHELEKMSEKLGSDVPYCVAGGTALAQGRGEILEDLPPLPKCYVVICKPQISFSTPEMFERIDGCKILRRPDTAGVIRALEKGDLKGVARRMYNVFEDVIPASGKEIGVIKCGLLDHGAVGAVMSGTGSASFGLFDSERSALSAWENLKQRYKYCYLCETIDRLEI